MSVEFKTQSIHSIEVRQSPTLEHALKQLLGSGLHQQFSIFVESNCRPEDLQEIRFSPDGYRSIVLTDGQPQKSKNMLGVEFDSATYIINTLFSSITSDEAVHYKLSTLLSIPELRRQFGKLGGITFISEYAHRPTYRQ